MHRYSRTLGFFFKLDLKITKRSELLESDANTHVIFSENLERDQNFFLKRDQMFLEEIKDKEIGKSVCRKSEIRSSRDDATAPLGDRGFRELRQHGGLPCSEAYGR